MLKQERWSNRLTHQDRVEVTISKGKGNIIDFSVQYLAEIHGEWYAIIRFDTAHGSPHMDINRPDGSKDTRYIRGLDMRESLTYALNVVGEHWELYREQYERGLRK